MDFENERYVRTYTRDTTAGLMMAWDEHTLFFALKRKVDRAGILDLDGYGAGGLVPHLRCPVDVAERALAAWLRAGWVEIHGDLLLIPDHIEAEEAGGDAEVRRRRAVRKAVRRLEILERDGSRCRYCHRPVTPSTAHIDHVLPVSRGGDSDPANLVTACVPCNLTKGDQTPDECGMFIQPMEAT